MSVRRLAPLELQPGEFVFTPENEAWVERQIAKYPPGRQASAVIPLLWRAQEQAGGWVPQAAIEAIAERLDMAKIRVLEVATFYTMFNLAPEGRYFIQLCGTTPCVLRGADAVKKVLTARVGEQRHVTPDGNFSWLEVECLGACCNAPMVQINQDYYEDLSAEIMEKLLDDLAAGRPVKSGSQTGRVSSEPVGGPATLTDPALYDGSVVGSWRKRFEEERAKRAAAAAPHPEPARAAAPAASAPAEPAPAKPPAAPAVQAAGEADSAKVPRSDGAVGGAVSDEHKPTTLPAARDGKADDLKLIWGLGRKLEELLNRLGIYHFDQIAGWSDLNLRWIDQHLGSFRGRAVRDDWIGQAKKLASGWRPKHDVGDRPQR
jgi:NADH-quinone oxidoreductase subunit E